jgi:hypothetical protein
VAAGLRVGRPFFAVSAAPAGFRGARDCAGRLISLTVFLGVAGLDIGQFRIAGLVSITAMTLAGSCFSARSHVEPRNRKEGGDRDYDAEGYRPHNQQTIAHDPNMCLSYTAGAGGFLGRSR